MPLTLSLPPVDPRPANPPETRPAKVFPWLDEALTREPVEAARVIGDALAATNRVAMSDSRASSSPSDTGTTAAALWPQLEKHFAQASHPLSGDALDAAKAALGLAHELSVAYKRLLAARSGTSAILLGGQPAAGRADPPLPAMRDAHARSTAIWRIRRSRRKTWLDAHCDLRVRARARRCTSSAIAHDQPEMTPERVYLQALLLALANPYGFLPGQLDTVIRYLQEFCHWAKLTDVAPVHRMAKAVAIIPVGHDFPPFSANKGGSIDGSKIFLLDVRPRVPDPGAGARARSRRRRSRRHRPRRGVDGSST